MLLRRKLPRSSFVLLVVAVACALSAGLVMQAYARRLERARPDGGAPMQVVAAARPIARGATIAADSLEVVTVPSRFAPPGAVRDPARAAGRVAVAEVAAGEILTRLRLAGGGAGRVAALVPAGMRAVELPVGATAGVEPGDVVDVLATFGGGGAHTEVVAQAIEVLRVRRDTGGALGGGGTAGALGLLVLCEPDEAERLAFAAAFATISVALRGPDDAVDPFGLPATASG